MEQPRQQHYHFAYTALPSKIFAGRVPSILLATYPSGLVCVLFRLWEVLGEQLPQEQRAPVEGLKVTAHRIGGKHVVLLVHMPPPERMLETYFIAIVFTPSVRYLLLGRGVSLPGMPEQFQRPTLRELSPDGVNANLGMGPPPSAEALLRHLCKVFDLQEQVEAVSDGQVQALADEPACGPPSFDAPLAGEQGRKRRWWEFWK